MERGEDNEAEVWKPVVGYEGWYEVSSYGRIRRVMPSRGTRPGKMRRWGRYTNGYLSVTLNRERTRKTYSVHSLVAAAFLGPTPDGCEINHRDGNKENNHPSNLEFLTHADNMQHAARLSLFKRGEQRTDTKLRDKDVKLIRDELSLHMTTGQIAGRYSVHPRTIRYLLAGYTYRHLLSSSS